MTSRLGTRSSDNCYLLAYYTLCHKTNVQEVELWHQRLGHLNYRMLKKIVSIGAVKGVPCVKAEPNSLCGPCKIGKQVRASHKVVQVLTTARVSELLHIDLMGPMQVESIGGRRYFFVCMDDYSQYI